MKDWTGVRWGALILVWLAAALLGVSAQERKAAWTGFAPRFEQPVATAERLLSLLPDAVLTKDDGLAGGRDPRWAELDTSVEEIRRALTGSRPVGGQRWLRDFNHVSGGDQSGWLAVPGEDRLQWMLRPGGLAAILYPDGGVIYLVACRLLEGECPGQQPQE